MGRVAEARAWFADADVLLTVENTYRPELNGTRRRIVKVGASYFDAVMLDDSAPYGERGTVQRAGSQCRGNIPTRALDIIAMADDEVTFALGYVQRLKGHTVTFRKAAA
jgi:hypothetical protein